MCVCLSLSFSLSRSLFLFPSLLLSLSESFYRTYTLSVPPTLKFSFSTIDIFPAQVDLFSDLNRYRHSSCGVHFFSTPAIPRGYVAESVFGFVEELVVNDDPEYKWIDKIRTPRASNEARQRLFSTMSGAVQVIYGAQDK